MPQFLIEWGTIEGSTLNRRHRAFTLVELLVSIAVVAILAALLFPVFRSAKAAAERSSCASRFRNVLQAHNLYSGDYDDHFVIARYRLDSGANAANDRKWPQLLKPYLKSATVFQCPSDRGDRPAPQSLFDSDLAPNDVDAWFYAAAGRSNLGYNAIYLAPMDEIAGYGWMSFPITTSSVAEPSGTIQFVDSVYQVLPGGGTKGGGRYVVLPPCRFTKKMGAIVDTFGGTATTDTPEEPVGWAPTGTWNERSFGGAWPWHLGRMTMGLVDGSVRAVDPSDLIQGCRFKPNWQGQIVDTAEYHWDPF